MLAVMDGGHELARALDSAAIQVREMQRTIDAKDAEIDRLAKANGEQCDRIYELEQRLVALDGASVAAAVNAPAEGATAREVGGRIVISAATAPTPTPIADDELVELRPTGRVRRRLMRGRRLLILGDESPQAVPLTASDEERMFREERADG